MSQRVVRLVSAGVPISDAFQAAVEEIIDNGSASFDGLAKRIEEVMRFKETRLIREAAWRTWADFAADIVNQLLEVGTITFINDKYYAPEFVRGTEYAAIPNANPKVVYTVWDEKTRTQRDRDAMDLMDAVRIYADIEKVLDRGVSNDSALEYFKKAERAMLRVKSALRGGGPQVPRREAAPRSHERKRTGMTSGTEDAYLEFAGRARWFTATNVVAYWNVHHPDQDPLPNSSGSITRKLKTDYEAGRLDRRGTAPGYEYWVKLQGFQPRLPCGGRGFPVY